MTRNTAEGAFHAAKKDSVRAVSADRIMVRSMAWAGNRAQLLFLSWLSVVPAVFEKTDMIKGHNKRVARIAPDACPTRSQVV